MRIVILDTNYQAFLDSFFQSEPASADLSYAATWRRLMDRGFGTADYYSRWLAPLGHRADELIVNAVPLQERWVREHAPGLSLRGKPGSLTWEMAVVAEQVRQLDPEVVYLQDVTHYPAPFLEAIRGPSRILVGQTAYPIDWSYPLRVYDLVVSSFPHYVERFESMGIPARYLTLAFPAEVLDAIPKVPRDIDVTFAGSFTASHRDALPVLLACARSLPIQFWGVGDHGLENADIRRRYRGPAWGVELFAILARTKVGLNRHIEAAGPYANNMRLYETTGLGACLVTEARQNLGELFKIDREVVTYTSPQDCVERIAYLLDHQAEAGAIAAAGQQRTLHDHTYPKRMAELAGALEDALRMARSRGPRVPVDTGSFEHSDPGARLRGVARNARRRVSRLLKAAVEVVP